jgi:hypothetical protein
VFMRAYGMYWYLSIFSVNGFHSAERIKKAAQAESTETL